MGNKVEKPVGEIRLHRRHLVVRLYDVRISYRVAWIVVCIVLFVLLVQFIGRDPDQIARIISMLINISR